MIQGKTKSGFEFEIEDGAAEDYELLEALVAVDRGEYARITDAVDLLLGEENKKRLLDHVRGKNGRVSAKKVVSEFREILNVANGKNS